VKNLRQFLSGDAQRENRGVAIHHGRDGGIERVLHSEFGGKFLDAKVIRRIRGHEHISDAYAEPLLAQETNSRDGALEGMGQLGNGIMHFGTMRVNADLNGVDVELADSSRFFFVDHDRVGLDLDVEHQTPGVFHDFKKVAAQEDFAAAEG
jgi:hypothetical protein